MENAKQTVGKRHERQNAEVGVCVLERFNRGTGRPVLQGCTREHRVHLQKVQRDGESIVFDSGGGEGEKLPAVSPTLPLYGGR